MLVKDLAVYLMPSKLFNVLSGLALTLRSVSRLSSLSVLSFFYVIQTTALDKEEKEKAKILFMKMNQNKD